MVKQYEGVVSTLPWHRYFMLTVWTLILFTCFKNNCICWCLVFLILSFQIGPTFHTNKTQSIYPVIINRPSPSCYNHVGNFHNAPCKVWVASARKALASGAMGTCWGTAIPVGCHIEHSNRCLYGLDFCLYFMNQFLGLDSKTVWEIIIKWSPGDLVCQLGYEYHSNDSETSLIQNLKGLLL